jgi:aerobic-type carbon monoxide dehydrogenase small subunit (CoxS/CutS family)
VPRIKVLINGEKKQLEVALHELLLDVLRREGYWSVKRVCETGDCGACAVMMGGKIIDTCLTLAMQADGREILTCEGLETEGRLHPIQEVFLTHGAVQCGFCTPGMILTAKALLDERPDATEAEIRDTMTLCRCTGYVKPVEAVLAMQKQMRSRARAGDASGS